MCFCDQYVDQWIIVVLWNSVQGSDQRIWRRIYRTSNVVGIPECQFGPLSVTAHRGLLSQEKHALDRCLRWINSCTGMSLHFLRFADASGIPKLWFRHGTGSEPGSSHVLPHDWSIFQEKTRKSGSHRHIGYRGRSHHFLLQFCKDHQIPLLTAVGLEEDLILLLQFHLGISYSVGSGIFGILLVKKNAECIIGKQYLCQTAMVIMGLGLMSVSAAQGYYGFVLFAWMYGVPCGGLHYSLKMLVFEKIRAKSFSRAWAYVEWAQSIPVLIGIPVAGYISGSAGSRSGFYFSAAFSFAGAAALFLNRLTSRSPLGRRRGQGSCSTCTSQTPSCCCTQEFHLASQQGSSSGHPKCQKTISFSDTVDIADEDSPRRYPYTGKRFEGQNNFQEQPEPQDDVADHWDNDPNEFEENVDFDMVDDNVVICYDNGRPTNNKVVVVEDHKIINRYGCGHVEEEIDAGALQLAVPKRQMTIIEEVTSSV
ncbi:unnamed protein product [Larinioides sclopetarius]|uniref:Uncharacterized protein n=1 Tax=Larinioides sclopetarius TaxID=280406 RepID=A0AAV1ZVK6_9ARAC